MALSKIQQSALESELILNPDYNTLSAAQKLQLTNSIQQLLFNLYRAAEKTNYINSNVGTSFILPEGANLSKPKNVGTTPFEIWYTAGAATNVAYTTTTVLANRITAVYCEPESDGVIDRIEFEVTGFAVSGNAYIGIWTWNPSASPASIYPTTLLYASAPISIGSNGVKTISGLSISVEVNKVYWFGILPSGNVGLRALALSGVNTRLGRRFGGNPEGNNRIGVAHSYGSGLPNPFVAGAALEGSSGNLAPIFNYRLSS